MRKSIQRAAALLLTFCLILCLLPAAALASEREYSGYDGGSCGRNGSNLNWVAQSPEGGGLGKLIIYGQGPMKGYSNNTTQTGTGPDSRTAPWYQLRQHPNVAGLVLEEGITTIGSAAFDACIGLTGELVLPSTLQSIGWCAFQGCNFSGNVVIPANVTEIQSYAFTGCSGLDAVIFEGNAPEISTTQPTFDKDIVLFYHAGATGWTDSPKYNAQEGTYCGYTLKRIGGSDLDDAIPAEYHWATFDPRPGRFPKSGQTDVFYEEGGTAAATKRMNGRYLLKDIPPAPVREGYTFTGWRINLVDGREDSGLTGRMVEDFTSFDFPADLTFAAEWKENTPTPGPAGEPPFRIDFNPNGGTITSIRGFPANQIIPGTETALNNEIFVDQYSGIGMMMTGKDGQLDSFPVVERAGYTLLGWGRSETELASASTAFSQDTTLTAYWTSGRTYTVTFHLNGMSGAVPPSQKVPAGGTVKLPPAPSGPDSAKFVWWGYTEDNKTLREWKADTPVTADLTLYAAWDGPAATTYFGYQFGNSSQAFGYPNGYKIPYKAYASIYGDTALARQIYEQSYEWSGSCYGMCATSVMFVTGGNGVSVSDFRSGASMPRDLSPGDRNSRWGMTLTEFIEAMHISQSAAPVTSEYGRMDDLNAMCQAVLDAKEAGGGYPLINMYGSYGTDGLDAHTVAGFDLLRVDDRTSRLMVYDPTFPNTERYITLQKNNVGQYTGWYYPYKNQADWGSGYKGSGISFSAYKWYSSVWKSTATDKAMSLLNVSSNSAVVRDRDGKTVANIKDGVVSSSLTNVYPLMMTDTRWSGTALWLPTGCYTVTNTDPAAKTFEAVMTNVDQSAAVATTGSTVCFDVDDGKRVNYVKLDEAGAEYTITLYSTLGSGLKDVCLSGKVNSTLAFAQSSGKLYADGAADSSLQIDGAFVSTEENLSSQMADVNSLIGLPSGTAPEGPAFTDVPAGAYYADAVAWAVEKGITSGTGAATFSPDASCTRAQTVTFLWRAAGSPEPKGASNPFTDVKAGEYYYKAVLWAVENGITSGMTPTTFAPDATVSRGQTVAFLHRAAGNPPVPEVDTGFADVGENDWYRGSVQWAVANKITSGVSDTAFGPGQSCTRGQIVTFLYRAR